MDMVTQGRVLLGLSFPNFQCVKVSSQGMEAARVMPSKATPTPEPHTSHGCALAQVPAAPTSPAGSDTGTHVP